MRLINLTPYSINLEGQKEIPSSGIVRVEETTEKRGHINVGNGNIDIISKNFGKVDGLPKPKQNTFYIVSRLVAQAYADRNDLLVPGEIIRNDKGQIIGYKNLCKI